MYIAGNEFWNEKAQKATMLIVNNENSKLPDPIDF